MQEEVVKVDGEDVLVREDTAKKFRFVHWGYMVAGIGLAIMVVLGIFLFLGAAADGKLETPANLANANK